MWIYERKDRYAKCERGWSCRKLRLQNLNPPCRCGDTPNPTWQHHSQTHECREGWFGFGSDPLLLLAGTHQEHALSLAAIPFWLVMLTFRYMGSSIIKIPILVYDMPGVG